MKHAAAPVTEFKIPAHYALVSTQDYPFALLVENYEALGDAALPVAHGVALLHDARYPDRSLALERELRGADCEACGSKIWENTGVGVQTTASGGGNPEYHEPWHLTCLMASDHYGLVPTSAIEWVGVE